MIYKQFSHHWHPLLKAAMLGIAVATLLTGCLSSSGPGGRSGGLLFPGQREAALKKKVEADKFPSAQQAGVSSAAIADKN